MRRPRFLPLAPSRSLAWLPVTVSCALGLSLACSSGGSEGGAEPGPSTGGSSAGQGGSASAGSSVLPQGGSGGGSSAGAGTQAGSNAGGTNATGGTGGGQTEGGMPGGGAPAGGSTSAGSGGLEPGDTPPDRPLNVTAAVGEHIHGQAGVDTRAKSLGKLVVDIGVNSGGYSSWLAKRGYHSVGAPCGSCPAPNLDAGRDEVGNCRMKEFETTKASVKQTLTNLQNQYPEEDWGYFLTKSGDVRWSDVAITGMSHGATTAAVAGRIGERMWRVVSRSGPRDTTCGQNGGVCTLPLSTPSYDANCPAAKIASWLDAESKTPLNRFYGLVGTTDVECGDIMFDMHYAKYPGNPVIWNEAGAVLTGTSQFFSTEGGHLDFLQAANKPMNTEAVLDIAFGIPPENQNPKF
ncbi:MAG TPA: hypothetical protein VHB79_32880 [Polyangiaceae bacterium]|nr:hypothetical protein [Polyangiaceae bacterium]